MTHDYKINHVDAKSIVTHSKIGCQANPYVGCLHACRYCYAQYMSRWTQHEKDVWGEFIDVKTWPELTDKQKQKLAGKSIFLSSVTDPYGPQEVEFKRTRLLLEQLKDADASIHIVTKSDLVVRDIDLLMDLDVEVSLSIESLNESFALQLSNAPSPAKRVDALKTLHEAGVKTSLFVAPVFPEISDITSVIDACKEHVDAVYCEALNLRTKKNRAKILTWIASNFPELMKLYLDVYSDPKMSDEHTYWDKLKSDLVDYANENDLMITAYESLIKKGCSPVIDIGFTHTGYKSAASIRADDADASRKGLQ